MQERDLLMKELWKRLASVPGVKFTARNPAAPPNEKDMPAIQFFELNDAVIDAARRGQYIAYKRKATVVVEVMIAATTEAASTSELADFVSDVKKAIYAGGPTLGNKGCLIQETEASRVLRPSTGSNLVGMGFVFDVIYTEDVNQLFS